MLIDDCVKIARMDTKWRSFRGDTREVLAIAFEDIIERPQCIGSYSNRMLRTTRCVFCLHYIRTGFCAFVLADTPNFPIILVDAELNDGMPVYV